MSEDVEFYEEEPSYIQRPEKDIPTVVRWVLVIGIVKTRRQAEYVVLGMIAVAIITSVVLFTQSGASQRDSIPGADIDYTIPQ